MSDLNKSELEIPQQIRMNPGEKMRTSRAAPWLFRRAIFQIHLWTGIGIGLYVLVMSLSGTILVYHNELSNVLSRQPELAIQEPRLTRDELKQAAQAAFPGFEVLRIVERKPDQPVEIWMARGRQRLGRWFNPYTGRDTGNVLRGSFLFVEWLVDLHGDLLGGWTGRVINACGGLLVTLLALTGIVIWWPGVRGLRRSLALGWRSHFKLSTWSLHRLLGAWFFLFVAMWGISGIYLAIPNAFQSVVDFLTPINSRNPGVRFGDRALLWLSELHFGRFAGLPLQILWSMLGLVPAALFLTGALLWWKRVLRPWLRERLPKAEVLDRPHPKERFSA